MDFMEKYAAYDDTYVKTANLWDSYVNNLKGRSEERQNLRNKEKEHVLGAFKNTIVYDTGLRNAAGGFPKNYKPSLDDIKVSARGIMGKGPTGLAVFSASNPDVKDPKVIKRVTDARYFKLRALENLNDARNARKDYRRADTEVGLTRLGTGAALGGLVYGASKLMKRAGAYDYPDERELYMSKEPRKPDSIGMNAATGALGGAFYGGIGGLIVGNIKKHLMRGAALGAAVGTGLGIYDRYRYNNEISHPEEYKAKLKNNWEKQGLPLLHWSEKHYADNAIKHPYAPKGYTAEQALKDYRRSNHNNRPYLDEFAWEAEGALDEGDAEGRELEFKSLPKIASLAAAAKIVKGVGSTLKSGVGSAAGTVGFSAVGAGLNQTPKQSNNFNPPESEG